MICPDCQQEVCVCMTAGDWEIAFGELFDALEAVPRESQDAAFDAVSKIFSGERDKKAPIKHFN